MDNTGLFRDLMANVRLEVARLAEALQRGMNEVAGGLAAEVGETMDLVRSEHAAAEGDRNPEFRRRVGEATAAAVLEMTRLGNVFGLDDVGLN